ncbi:hypothetical protein OKW45_005050 [Paraburkholderia sp. WSM4175]
MRAASGGCVLSRANSGASVAPETGHRTGPGISHSSVSEPLAPCSYSNGASGLIHLRMSLIFIGVGLSSTGAIDFSPWN